MTKRIGAIAIGAAVLSEPARAGAGERERRDEPRPVSTFVWTNVEGGFESVHLTTFTADADKLLVGFAPRDATGPMVGVGAGLRLVFLTLGARARYATFAQDSSASGGMNLFWLDGELGFRAPLGRLEPHIELAAGYASLGGLASSVRGLEDGIAVNGLNVRGSFGVDWFFAKHVWLGAGVGAELLGLTRPGVSTLDLATAKQVGTLDEAKARVLQASGSSWGTGWNGALSLGVAF
jgi:hypothetical protein